MEIKNSNSLELVNFLELESLEPVSDDPTQFGKSGILK